ncbi:MAG: 3-phosphoshikimate 1-carboxyvinyltransferase [Planctomycetota bacterium]|nr:3-phosphoshikimate 1-carboxyvinyltransferase [Planctomycetota bacterium]
MGDGVRRMKRDERWIAYASRPFLGSIRLDGSKSLTNRALILAAIADGPSELIGALASDDTCALTNALAACDVSSSAEENSLRITPRVGGAPLRGGARVNLGDGGTPTRFMMALAALADAPIEIDGSRRMRERPVAEGAALLREVGADVAWLGKSDSLPLRVSPVQQQAKNIRVGKTASSQFVSALMLIAPKLPQGLALEFTEPLTSESYIDLTLVALEEWGVHPTVDRHEDGTLARIVIESSRIQGGVHHIEADASSAVYWWGAAAIIPGSQLIVEGLPSTSHQPDMAVREAIIRMGGVRHETDQGCGIAFSGDLHGIEVDASTWPDGAVLLAALAAAAHGVTRISGLHTLRVKESDRIAALENNIRLLGCPVRSGDDWIEIVGPCAGEFAVTIDPRNDHRIAMAFTVLGLRRSNLTIRDPSCVEKSYPRFWDDLRSLSEPTQ